MSARTATESLQVTWTATVKNTLDSGKVAQASHGGVVIDADRETGVSGTQTNRAFEDTGRTLSSGASEVVDLYDFAAQDIGAGAGNDALGLALVFEEIVTVVIQCTSGAGALEIEPDATNGWSPIGTHTVATGGALRAGGTLLKDMPDEAAFDVTDASSHRVKFTANGGDLVYSIRLSGRHDDNESSSSSSSSLSSSSSSGSSSSSST